MGQGQIKSINIAVQSPSYVGLYLFPYSPLLQVTYITVGIIVSIFSIPYDGRESTSIPPDSPHQTTPSTTATVPRRSIHNRHVKRRLHMCAKRKLHSSKLFRRSGPTYTPYHMMAESRPLYLLIRLIRSPLRLHQSLHADQ